MYIFNRLVFEHFESFPSLTHCVESITIKYLHTIAMCTHSLSFASVEMIYSIRFWMPNDSLDTICFALNWREEMMLIYLLNSLNRLTFHRATNVRNAKTKSNRKTFRFVNFSRMKCAHITYRTHISSQLTTFQRKHISICIFLIPIFIDSHFLYNTIHL